MKQKLAKKYIKGIKGEFTLTDFMQKAGRFIRFEVFFACLKCKLAYCIKCTSLTAAFVGWLTSIWKPISVT